MKICPSCGRKLYLQEKYCPVCNYYMGNISDTQKELCYNQTSKPTVTCPYCQSTNCEKISFGHRWLFTGLFGLASSDVGKQWKCKKCGSKF